MSIQTPPINRHSPTYGISWFPPAFLVRSMQDRQSSISDLLDAYLRGVSGAREHLASWLRQDMIEVCRRLLGESLGEAEDAAQESLIAVFTYLDRRGAFPGNIGAFAATVARNRCLDILRRRRRRSEGTIFQTPRDDKTVNPLDELIAEELRVKLDWAMSQLDPACCKLLVQNYFKEESIKRISRREAGGNLQLIYYRRRRCLLKLGKILKLLEFDVD